MPEYKWKPSLMVPQELQISVISHLWYVQVWHEGRGGIEVKFDGFSHKLPVLVQTVFQSLADFKVAYKDRATKTESDL